MDHIEDIKDKLDLFLIEQKELSRKHPEKLSMANTQFYALKLKYDRDHDKITNHLAQSSVSLNQQVVKLKLKSLI